MNNKGNKIVTGAYIERPCPKCNGTGAEYHCWCKACGADLTGKVWWSGGPLPCGHDRSGWDEREEICSECDGTGKVRHAVSIEELAEMLAPLIAAAIKEAADEH